LHYALWWWIMMMHYFMHYALCILCIYAWC
jgi:hypothetical protein